jgi:hypothetical protein
MTKALMTPPETFPSSGGVFYEDKMATYKEQLEFINRINLREGEHRTLDCPFCQGRRKFTVDRLHDGRTVWNCFKASCSVKGSKRGYRSVDAAKSYLAGNTQEKRQRSSLPLPQITTKIENSDIAMEYLRGVNSLEAYQSGLINIRFDPRTKRVLFYTSDGTGAVGRSLHSGPKWISYGDTSKGIHVGVSKVGVIVEDAASACAVARIEGYTGIGILGTNLSNVLKNTLRTYNKLYIVLDNDARKKALQLQNQIRGNVFLRTTTKDPKELGVRELIAVIDQIEDTN